ncbi:hypothetical protein [Pseudomonas sp.]|uniref:hypothetical protein n=1 Tax=Pseudomonas sp. TaxID=306 RepID=UPI003A96C295
MARHHAVTDYLIDPGYESVYLTYATEVVVQRQEQLVQRTGELYRAITETAGAITRSNVICSNHRYNSFSHGEHR